MTPELADAIVAQLALGASLDDTALIAGISPRTLRAWRARAWSTSPRDAPFVAFEKRLRDVRAVPAVETWEAAAARLVENERDWLAERAHSRATSSTASAARDARAGAAVVGRRSRLGPATRRAAQRPRGRIQRWLSDRYHSSKQESFTVNARRKR
jgi:hypothetical protein